MDREPKKYLVHFKFCGTEPLLDRLKESVPIIMMMLKRFSEHAPVQIYRSDDGGTFGFLIKSKLPARAIRSQIESPGTNDWWEIREGNAESIPSPTQLRDQLLVLEIGDEHADLNLNMISHWIQKN